MSSTRYAPPGSPLSQERWASSPGPLAINAGLVALRLAKTRQRGHDLPAECLERIWGIQSASHQPGGLAPLVTDILNGANPASKEMIELGFGAGRIYNRNEVESVRCQIGCKWTGFEFDYDAAFLLKGEKTNDEMSCIEALDPISHRTPPDEQAKAKAIEALATAQARPTNLEAGIFVDWCRDRAKCYLKEWLVEYCLNPDVDINSVPVYFSNLDEAFRDYLKRRSARINESIVTTQVVTALRQQFEQARASVGRVELLEGTREVGQDFAARTLCDAAPGSFNFVETPPGNGLGELVNAILRAQGASDSRNYNIGEKKRRAVEIATAPGAPTLVLNHGHLLLPQQYLRSGFPERMTYVLDLIHNGASVIIIADIQFLERLGAVEKQMGWNSDLLTEHLVRHELPTALTREELSALATAMLPGVSPLAAKAASIAAAGSDRPFPVLKNIAKQAAYIAKREGRPITDPDVREAMRETTTSNAKLGAALKRAGIRSDVLPAVPAPESCEAVADAAPAPRGTPARRTISPVTQPSTPSRRRGKLAAVERTVAPA